MADQPEQQISVRDDSDGERFLFESNGHIAQLLYRKEPGRLILLHTEVPGALGGRGIAGKLVQAAVASAAFERRTVVPWCPYARRWLQDHEDAARAVSIDWADAPQI